MKYTREAKSNKLRLQINNMLIQVWHIINLWDCSLEGGETYGTVNECIRALFGTMVGVKSFIGWNWNVCLVEALIGNELWSME